jgi:hypothetical protein
MANKANRNCILSSDTDTAHGLHCLNATRTGETHYVSFVPARAPGMMYIVEDEVGANRITLVTVEQAREEWQRFTRAHRAVPMKPRVDFIGVDYCGRYVFTRAEVNAV